MIEIVTEIEIEVHDIDRDEQKVSTSVTIYPCNKDISIYNLYVSSNSNITLM